MRLVFAILISLVSAAPALGAASKLYYCDIVNYQTLGEEGALVTDKQMKRLTRHLTFDEKTGVLRMANSDLSFKYEVAQYGTASNSSVGTRKVNGPARSGVSLIQIQTWKESMPFIYWNGYFLVTGHCKVL